MPLRQAAFTRAVVVRHSTVNRNDVSSSFGDASLEAAEVATTGPCHHVPHQQGSLQQYQQQLLTQVEVLSGKRRGGRDAGRSPQELPFSEDAKRVFEAALTVRPFLYRPLPPSPAAPAPVC